jgi:hypothetical protein
VVRQRRCPGGLGEDHGAVIFASATLCPRYLRDASSHAIVDEQALKDRYAHLVLRDNSVLTLESLCPMQAFLQTGELTGILAAVTQ